MTEFTQPLCAIELGDPIAAEKLLPLVYDELRNLASSWLAHEKPGQTLQATALVHEAYLRLIGSSVPERSWNNRRYFFAAAAEAMRRILVENARSKQCSKHGGAIHRVSFHDFRIGVDAPPDEFLLLNELIDNLSAADASAAELVKLHCFAGLSLEQAAAALGVSVRTAYRDWAYAKSWLFRHLENQDPSS